MIYASVISLLDGGAPCAKFPDVLVLMDRTVVGMANVTVQIISASVNQGGLVSGVISPTVPAFQTALVVDTVTQLAA